MNYFSLFNLPQQFEIDTELLKQRYQTLQRMTHPDKFAASSDQEKRLYMQKNAQVNDGFYVLKSPVTRGEHILELRGFELQSEQKTIGDNVFLMQQMELREQMDDAQSEQDFAELQKHTQELIEQYKTQIEQLLQADTESDNEAAAAELNKLKFLIKLAKEAREREQNKLNQ